MHEVRASDDDVAVALGEGWHTVHEEASAKGRAGVAVSTRTPPVAVWARLAPTTAGEFDGAGRWVEADLATGSGTLAVVPPMCTPARRTRRAEAEKEAFLDAAAARLAALAAQGRHVLLTGDLNVPTARRTSRTGGATARSRVLPQERGWFDRLLAGGVFVDVVRALSGEGPSPYSWWS